MPELPHIDEISRPIDAPAERVWSALVRTMGRTGGRLPGPVLDAWGLEPAHRRGEWSSRVLPGDAIVGFGVRDVDAPRSLTLEGHHRFSRYRLHFEVTAAGTGTVLHAHTSALFPGVRGRIYRALVIGTGAHQIAVRRLLRAVARRARLTAASRGAA